MHIIPLDAWHKNSIIPLSRAERQGISVVPFSPSHERPSMEEEYQGELGGVEGTRGEGGGHGSSQWPNRERKGRGKLWQYLSSQLIKKPGLVATSREHWSVG